MHCISSNEKSIPSHDFGAAHFYNIIDGLLVLLSLATWNDLCHCDDTGI